MTADRHDAPVSRRRFLKSTTVGAAGAIAVSAAGCQGEDANTGAAAPVAPQKTYRLKMQSSWGANSIFQEFAQQYVDRCEAMSGGRLKFDLLPAGAVVKAFEVQNACDSGVIDCAHTVTAYWYGKNKAASLFGTGPVLGCDAAQMLGWINSKDGRELYRELVQDILGLDVIGFFTMPMPTQPLGWFKNDVTSLADLQGVKYRTVGLATDIMQGLGLSVTQLPGGDIIPAIERGVIDAFEYNNPTADRQFGAADVAKNYLLGSFHQASEFFEIIFSKRTFDRLPKDLQAILEHGAEAAATAGYGLAMDRYSADLQWLITEDKVNVHRTPQEVMEAQLKSWDVVMEKLLAEPFFKKVVDSQKAWAERVGYYHHLNNADYRLAYDHYFPGKLKT